MRDMRLLVRRLADGGMTVVLSSHLLAEVEELCNRVAIVRQGRMAYEGTLADLRRAAGTVYHLRTTDDDRALAVCAAQAGIEDAAPRQHGGIAFRAPSEQAVGELSLALAEAGALVLELAPNRATLEDLFFALTEGDGDAAPTPRAGRGREGGMRPGVLAVYRWELQKLRFQKRTYLGLGAAALVPIIFAVAVATQNGQPNDVAFGRYIHETGLAIPLVLLLFGSIWMFPLITALVAGDIVAAEDHNGTLKTILTRSVERGQVFVGKALATATYAIAAIALTGAVAVVAGSLASGLHPLPTLSGTTISTGRALVLIGASLLVYLIPILAIATIGLLFSTVFRNSAAAVVGTLMASLLLQLIGILPGPRAPCSPTCSARSSTPGRACCASPSTGRRSCAPHGCARSTPSRPSWRRCSSSCAATSRAAERCPSASSWSTTTRSCGGCSRAAWPPRASRSSTSPTAAPRWRRSSARRPTSWSST